MSEADPDTEVPSTDSGSSRRMWTIFLLLCLALALVLFDIGGVSAVASDHMVEAKVDSFAYHVSALEEHLLTFEAGLCDKLAEVEDQVDQMEAAVSVQNGTFQTNLDNQIQSWETAVSAQVTDTAQDVTTSVSASEAARTSAKSAAQSALGSQIQSAQSALFAHVGSCGDDTESAALAGEASVSGAVQAAENAVSASLQQLETGATQAVAALHLANTQDAQTIVQGGEDGVVTALAAATTIQETSAQTNGADVESAVATAESDVCDCVDAYEAGTSTDIFNVFNGVDLDAVFLQTLQDNVAEEIQDNMEDNLCEKIFLLMDDAGIPLPPIMGEIVMESVGQDPATFSFTVTSTNPAGGALSFALSAVDIGQGTALPPGHTFNTATGEFQWVEQAVPTLSFKLSVQVTDSLLNSSSRSVMLYRSPSPPVMDPIVVSVSTGGFPPTHSFTPSSTDPAAGGLTYALSSPDPLPPGHTFSPATGAFSWLGQGLVTSFDLVVTVTDGNGLTDQQAVTVTRVDVHPPVVGTVDHINATVGFLTTFTATGNDSLDGPPGAVTFALAPNAPAGPVLNPTTGVFNWAPVLGAVGTHLFDIEVSDGFQTTLIPVSIEVFDVLQIDPIPDFTSPFLSPDISHQAVVTGAPDITVTGSVSVAGFPGEGRPITIDPVTHLITSVNALQTPGAPDITFTVHAAQTGTLDTAAESFVIHDMSFNDAQQYAQLPTMQWPLYDEGFQVQATWQGFAPPVPGLTATIGGVPTTDVVIDGSSLITFAPGSGGFQGLVVIDVVVFDASDPVPAQMTFQIEITVPAGTPALSIDPIADFGFVGPADVSVVPVASGLPPFAFTGTAHAPGIPGFPYPMTAFDPVTGEVTTQRAVYVPGAPGVQFNVSVTDSTVASAVTESFVVTDLEFAPDFELNAPGNLNSLPNSKTYTSNVGLYGVPPFATSLVATIGGSPIPFVLITNEGVITFQQTGFSGFASGVVIDVTVTSTETYSGDVLAVSFQIVVGL